jgi:hypothetical protein
MKLPKLLTRLLAVAFTTAAFSVASAAPLTGAVSSAGTLCLGSDPAQTVCTEQDVSTITYLDFIIGGVNGVDLQPSPGAPGALLFLTASGDLAPLVAQIGQINDFALPGPGDDLSGFTMVTPLWSVTGSDGALYEYDLEGLTAVIRGIPNSLDVRGFGTLCRNGADCNLFSFIFTTQNATGSIRTTFSLSQSGFPMPEPGSLALLGLGLAALAFRARRRAETDQ